VGSAEKTSIPEVQRYITHQPDTTGNKRTEFPHKRQTKTGPSHRSSSRTELSEYKLVTAVFPSTTNQAVQVELPALVKICDLIPSRNLKRVSAHPINNVRPNRHSARALKDQGGFAATANGICP